MLALLLIPLLGFFTVAVHEAGHVLGARFSGMTTLVAQIGFLELRALRRGWRVRLSRPHIRADGFIIAAPDPVRSMRRQFLVFTASGPAANILVAAAFGLLSVMLKSGPLQVLSLAVALLNLSVGVSNLVPCAQPVANDGYQLWQWLRGRPDDDPQVMIPRLMGLSVRGHTADRIPPEATEQLRGGDPGLELFADWMELKRAQFLGHWEAAAALGPALDRSVARLDDATRTAANAFLSNFRLEIEFSCAMRDRNAPFQLAMTNQKEVDWSAPYLLPRLKALEARLHGDLERSAHLLEISRLAADQSIDEATRLTEARLRAAIAEIRP